MKGEKDDCILLNTLASRQLCIVMMGQETQVRAEVEGHVFMLTLVDVKQENLE